MYLKMENKACREHIKDLSFGESSVKLVRGPDQADVIVEQSC